MAPAPLHRCYRHHVWFAACPDCTAWHLVTAAALRPDRADDPSPAVRERVPAAPRRGRAG